MPQLVDQLDEDTRQCLVHLLAEIPPDLLPKVDVVMEYDDDDDGGLGFLRLRVQETCEGVLWRRREAAEVVVVAHQRRQPSFARRKNDRKARPSFDASSSKAASPARRLSR
jgi:hypothetical protein